MEKIVDHKTPLSTFISIRLKHYNVAPPKFIFILRDSLHFKAETILHLYSLSGNKSQVRCHKCHKPKLIFV